MTPVLLAVVAACAGGDDGDRDLPDSADTAVETGEGVDQAEDDARVRALTGLPEGDTTCAEPQLVRVTDVYDGDTFRAAPDDGSRPHTVRIIGVDTPEIAHEEPAECYGDEAWDHASERLLGNLAWLTFDADCLDPYDRTLAYVFRDATDEGFFNRRLAREGYAEQMTVAPNDTFEREIAADVSAARADGAGMWSACAR